MAKSEGHRMEGLSLLSALVPLWTFGVVVFVAKAFVGLTLEVHERADEPGFPWLRWSQSGRLQKPKLQSRSIYPPTKQHDVHQSPGVPHQPPKPYPEYTPPESATDQAPKAEQPNQREDSSSRVEPHQTLLLESSSRDLVSCSFKRWHCWGGGKRGYGIAV